MMGKIKSYKSFFVGRDGALNILLSAFLVAAVIMAGVVMVDQIDLDVAYAKAKSAGASIKNAGAHKSSAGIVSQGRGPWVVKSDGKELTYVSSREDGELVELGLRIKYCDGVQMQQEADVKNYISVEKAPMAAYEQSEILTAPEAVNEIDKMNKAAANAVMAEKDADENAIRHGQDEEGLEAPVTISVNQVIEEDKAVKHKVKIIKTDEMVRGEQKTTVEGKDGNEHIVRDVVMENGEYAGSKVLESEVTDEAVTTVIYEGTKLSTRDKGELLVQYAMRFLGTKYVWGGTDERNGTDCSGFTMRMYDKLNIVLPRTSYEQEKVGEEVKYEDAQPGDLVLYPGHVGIYMGDNKMIHATDNFIKITDDCRYRPVLCIRRIFTDDDDVTQEMFDELFKDEYNEGAEAIAKEKLAELKYDTMKDQQKDTDDGDKKDDADARSNTENEKKDQ